MAAYLVMRIMIHDEPRWRTYRDAVVPLIAAFGGRHVTRGGAVERLEGDDGGRIALFEFPSMQALRSFWDSPDYEPVKDLRRGAATLDVWAVPSD